MYTLFLRYTIDPNKLAEWRTYAQAEFAPITESGGRITGYYAPTEFAGATSDAFATIDVGTMAEYEVYRARLAAHPRHQENARKIEASGAIHSIYRAIIQKVEPGGVAK
jgi:NIPSNAP protein